MARIFNIYFTHDDILHNAIVSVHQTPAFTEYILGNLDNELRTLLPGNKIIRMDSELFFPNIQPANSVSLINSIIKSLSRQLHLDNDARFEASANA